MADEVPGTFYRGELAQPEVGQISVNVAGEAIVLPTQTKVDRQALANFDIVLNKCIRVVEAVAVNNAARGRPHRENCSEDAAQRCTGTPARVPAVARCGEGTGSAGRQSQQKVRKCSNNNWPLEMPGKTHGRRAT